MPKHGDNSSLHEHWSDGLATQELPKDVDIDEKEDYSCQPDEEKGVVALKLQIVCR